MLEMQLCQIRRHGTKSFYMYSYNWYNDINKLKTTLNELSRSDYLEIRYEDLIWKPETHIQDCLNFIGLEFRKEFIWLNKPSENIGDAKGLTTILQNNTKKYYSNLTKHQIEKIESLTWPLLKYYDYEFQY